jgi:hypothetical protein
MSDTLVMWTVYESSRDYPGRFVARKWEIRQGVSEPIPTPEVAVGESLDAVRKAIPGGLYRQPRSPDDDPKIVEVWF